MQDAQKLLAGAHGVGRTEEAFAQTGAVSLIENGFHGGVPSAILDSDQGNRRKGLTKRARVRCNFLAAGPCLWLSLDKPVR